MADARETTARVRETLRGLQVRTTRSSNTHPTVVAVLNDLVEAVEALAGQVEALSGSETAEKSAPAPSRTRKTPAKAPSTDK